ncbi:MAG: hypothetical protein GX584_04525 [Clostridiaceae bacterium]|nr:hypothetical protein [Clostridiaceae bacterium]
MSILRNKLREKRIKYGLLEQIPCNNEETDKIEQQKEKGKQLPINIEAKEVFYKTYYYIDKQSDLTESEKTELLAYYQLDGINTIKNSVLFFLILKIIALILSIIIFIYFKDYIITIIKLLNLL